MNGPFQKPGALTGVTASVLGALGGGVLVSPPWVAPLVVVVASADIFLFCVIFVYYSTYYTSY